VASAGLDGTSTNKRQQYPEELDARLQAEQGSLAIVQASTGTLLTSELQQALANQQLRGQAAEIKAYIDALQASVDLHNNPADVSKLRDANYRLRSITPLPRPTSWQVAQVKQHLH